jgi:O-antigen ligase
MVLLAYSRIVEVVAIPGLMPVTGLLLLAYAFLSSAWRDSLRNAPTAMLLGLTIWMLPSAALGLWRGGSVELIMNIWSRSVLLFVIVACLVRNLNDVRRVMMVIAWSTATIVLLALRRPLDREGRLAIDVPTLSNPNDLAAFLVIGLPFCVWYVFDSRRWLVLRLLMAPVCAGVSYLLLRTGSRMGLLALAAVLVIWFFVSSRKVQAVLVAVAACGVAGFFLLPSAVQQRYLTILPITQDAQAESVQTDPAEEGGRQAGYAAASKQGRWQLFLNSLIVTLHNPILGVGPGNFSTANAQITREANDKALWLQTHNAYTQIASECGIPAALMFMGMVVYALRHSNRGRKAAVTRPGLRVHARTALCLFLAVAGYSVCAMFGSIGYGIHLPLLVALALPFERALTALPAPAAPARVPAGSVPRG